MIKSNFKIRIQPFKLIHNRRFSTSKFIILSVLEWNVGRFYFDNFTKELIREREKEIVYNAYLFLRSKGYEWEEALL